MGRPRCAFYTTEHHAPWVEALAGRLAEGGVEASVCEAQAWAGPAGKAAGSRRLLPAVDELVAAARARPFVARRFAAALVEAADVLADGVDPRAALAGTTVARRVGDDVVPWLGRLLAPLASAPPEADLVHVASVGWEAGPGIVAAARHGAVLVVSDADVFVREQIRTLERSGATPDVRGLVVDLVLALARTAYATADHVTAACHYVQQWQQELGADPTASEIVPDGVDPHLFSPGPAPSDGPPVVLQVAPVDPAHGTMTFVEVAARVRARRPEARFVHHGPVVDEDYAAAVDDRRRALGLGDRLVMAGPTDEPWAAYHAADVVCLTPAEDGYPHAAVEGLMCGRPVVSTDAGGAREVLGRVGLLAPPGRVDALAEAVVRVLALSPAARATMGAEARDRAVAHFSLDATVTAFRRLYDRLLRAPRRVAPPWVAAPDPAPPAAAPEPAPASPPPRPPPDPVHEARRLARTVTDNPDPAARRAAVRELERLLGEAAAS